MRMRARDIGRNIPGALDEVLVIPADSACLMFALSVANKTMPNSNNHLKFLEIKYTIF